MDPLANFVTTYILTLLIVWNMNRFAPSRVLPWTDIEFFLFFIVLPLTMIIAGRYIFRRERPEEETSAGWEEMDEVSRELAEV